jgi:Tol biopolymer transport system component
LEAAVGPVRVSQDGRSFVDQAGEPFFWLGDTQWELFHAFTVRDAASICEDRKSKGFSVLQIMILGVGGGTKPNVEGEKPFLNDDPLTPNERYFAHVDRMIETANEKGLVCAIGIYHKSNDYARLITRAKARGWAKWVAQRYKGVPNIIWSMYPEAKETSTPIVRELAAGLQEGDAGRHLITVHPDPAPASSSDPWHKEDWLKFNTIQTWNSGPANCQMVAADYARAPVKPVVNGEARYEQEGGTTPLDIRRGAYWSFLAGGYYSYGHGDNWRAPGNWKAWIDSPGSRHMAVYRQIATSLPKWWARVPDPSVFVDGPGKGNVMNAAARSAAGDWILVYLPTRATVAVHLNKLTAAGKADAFWIDPKTGDRTRIGDYPTSGQQSFTPPGGWDDCVLLVAKSATAAEKPKAAAKTGPTVPPAWLKDIPYRLVCETYRENNWELFMVNADGSNPVNLTKTPEINELYPHVSPDGTKISFLVNSGKGAATRRSAWYMNIDGTGRKKVADDVREACWSPDGTAIALLKAEFPNRYVHEDYASKGLAVYDLATGKITEHPNKDLHHLIGLCWAPGGKWFLATVYGGMGYGHTSLAFEAQGMKVFDLHIPGCRPDLTLDGKRLAWGSSVAELSIADIDLSGEKPVLSNRRVFVGAGKGMKVYHIDWSPDGKHVAFSRGPENSDMGVAPEQPGVTGKGWNLCVGNPATGQWVQVTTDGNSNKEPDWVPLKATAGGVKP